MRIQAAALGILCVTSVACRHARHAGGWEGTVDTTSSGVIVVHNAGPGAWDSTTAWRLAEELRIGGADDSGPGALSNPRTFEVDAAGRIYVIEDQPMELRVYGPDGNFLRRLMRSGSGPGEVNQGIGLAWDSLGHLWVVDQSNARFTVWDTSGARLAEHRRPISGFFTWQWAGAITRSGELIDITSARIPGEFRLAAVRLDSAFGVSDTLALPYWQGPAFEIRRENMSASYSIPFAPSLLWKLDPRGFVWSAITDRYRIVQRALGGDTVRVVEREVQPAAVTATEKENAIKGLDYFVKQGGVVDRSKIPDVKPLFTQLWVDDRGYLWTARSRPEGTKGSLLDVFDPDGRYLGEVSAPLSLQAVLIRGTALYATATDEDDAPVILRFRIQGR